MTKKAEEKPAKLETETLPIEAEKVCFVIMPIADMDGYTPGHFRRVYDFLIKPACKIAGFKAVRADDVMITNYIALDIVKRIIEADIALCDLSGRNPNVLYELGLRQAFNKPVTLLKDDVTSRIFDIQGFRDVPYDSSLRFDLVNAQQKAIAEVLKNTYESKGKEYNSLVSMLGIEAASIGEIKDISADTRLLFDAIQDVNKRLSNIEPKSRKTSYFPTSTVIVEDDVFINEIRTMNGFDVYAMDPTKFRVGDQVMHSQLGPGKIIQIVSSECVVKGANGNHFGCSLKDLYMIYEH